MIIALSILFGWLLILLALGVGYKFGIEQGWREWEYGKQRHHIPQKQSGYISIGKKTEFTVQKPTGVITIESDLPEYRQFIGRCVWMPFINDKKTRRNHAKTKTR